MKKNNYFIFLIIFILILLILFNIENINANNGKYYSQFERLNNNTKVLNINNISSVFTTTGLFNRCIYPDYPYGFEWPKGSQKTALYSAGISISCTVDTSTEPGIKKYALKQGMASYFGEYLPGYCENGIFRTDYRFRIYRVTNRDKPQTNLDWANWGDMVPFGAPFTDVNKNGIFEPFIDTPGVSNADQTLFMCITDANPDSHTSGEGFGGGTQPLGAEIHLTAWAYKNIFLQDVQFIKWVVINKSKHIWENIFISIVADPDLGASNDDYLGCDTSRNLAFCYNFNNNDTSYGNNPPAFGFLILRGVENRKVYPIQRYKMTSFVKFNNISSSPPPCESEPNGESHSAYLMMQGFKKDSTCWIDVSELPYKKTKLIYAGDPESNSGWTMYKGYMTNCNRDSTGMIYPSCPPEDVKFCVSSGSRNISVAPGDSQLLIVAQLIIRGTSNLNSVTKLKLYSDIVQNFYNLYILDTTEYTPPIPTKYYLFQNYPNPFNIFTVIKYHIPEVSKVSLTIYDISGREISKLVNKIQEAGEYKIIWDGSTYPSGIYFAQLNAGQFSDTRKLVIVK